MADFVFEDPFDDSLDVIRKSLFEQVEDLWPDPENRPDLREASLMWTLLSPIAFEIQRFQSDLNTALELGFLQFTFGEFLDLRGQELGLSRKVGADAQGILRFLGDIGALVPVGTTASTIAEDDAESYSFDTTDAGVLAGLTDPVSVNEIQKVQVAGYADFTLTLDTQTTSSIPYNASAATIKTALDLLTTPQYGSLGAGSGVTVLGTPTSGLTVEFAGTNTEFKDIKLMSVTPIPVNEEQSLTITGTGTFKLTFDGVETSTTFTQTSTVANIITAINTEIGPLSTSYPNFTVTTTTSPTSLAVTAGFNVIFSGGLAAATDVPLIYVSSKTGTIAPSSMTEVTSGKNITEGLESGLFVEEIQKGRNAIPLVITTDVNEKQSLSFKPAALVCSTTQGGQPGLKNRKEQLTIPAIPVSGSFKLVFSTDGGVTYPYTSAAIAFNASMTTLTSTIIGLPVIESGDILVTAAGGGTNPSINTSGAKYTIEFINNLRYSNNFRLKLSPIGGDNTLVDGGASPVVPSVAALQTGSAGINEKQLLKYNTHDTYDAEGVVVGSEYTPASGGTFTLYISDGGSNALSIPAQPYDVSAGDLQTALNAALVLARPLADPNSFVVTGSTLDVAPGLTIEYSGYYRYSNFLPLAITPSFTGTPSSGTLTLTTETGAAGVGVGAPVAVTPITLSVASVNGSAGQADPGPLTQDIEFELNSSLVLGGYGVLADEATAVRVATGFQTFKKTAGAAATPFTIVIDDGTNAPVATVGLVSDTATATLIKTAINAVVINPGPFQYSPSVKVEGTGFVDAGNTFTIHFDSATLKPAAELELRSYRSIVVTGITAEVGPKLTTPGAIFEVEYKGDNSPVVTSGGADWNNVASKQIELTGVVSGANTLQPRFILLQAGSGTSNTKQLMTLTHPNGTLKLKYGVNDPVKTTIISPKLDTASSIKYKLEELADIGAGNLTVTGGPFGTSPVVIEFSGANVDDSDQVMIESVEDVLLGGTRVGLIEDVKGHTAFNGLGGEISGVCEYGYTLVTKLGVKEGNNDPDYEEGYGETALSPLSVPTGTLTTTAIQIKINPIIQGADLLAVRAVRIYRSLNGGTYKLVATIPEENLLITKLGDEPLSTYMYAVDNVHELVFNATLTEPPVSNTTGVLDLSAQAQEILDTDGNKQGSLGNVGARTIELLDDVVSGIEKVTNPEPFGGGADRESDDDYRARLIEFAQKDPGAGNIDDYISWAKEVEGISNVSVLPEWQEIYGPLEGPGTVKVIVAGENSTLIPDSVVETVRAYIAGTIAIPDPDQESASATIALNTLGGGLEEGTYEYIYTYINVGKGETKPSASARIIVAAPNNSVEVSLTTGQGGIGPQNTVGRRIYRKKVDTIPSDDPEMGKYCLVAEILDNSTLTFLDDKAFADIPTWLGYPAAVYGGFNFDNLQGPYQRRKAPIVNSTSLFDGVAPIGAHITVESISDETIWIDSQIYPTTGWSVNGTGGTSNLTTALDSLLSTFFGSLPAGQDVKIVDIENVIHDHPGVKDFRLTTMFSPVYPLGTTDNIPIGPGVAASYSTAGTFSTWLNYPYDK